MFFVLAWAIVRRRRVLMSCGDDLVDLVEFVAPWATTAYADTEVAYVAGAPFAAIPSQSVLCWASEYSLYKEKS